MNRTFRWRRLAIEDGSQDFINFKKKVINAASSVEITSKIYFRQILYDSGKMQTTQIRRVQ